MTDTDYRRLSDFRFSLRRFLDFSQAAARSSGLTPQQHQILLAIKGLMLSGDSRIGRIAERLLLRHHSTVERVNRLAALKLVRKSTDPEDRRRVQVVLTAKAEKLLAALSATHLEELRRLRPSLQVILDLDDRRSRTAKRKTARRSGKS
ncbi:MAG TPA: helix-turn-helix domain-containing protein [Steroidobacteraceae bacterium]